MLFKGYWYLEDSGTSSATAFLDRRNGYGAHGADQLARQLRSGPDAAEQGRGDLDSALLIYTVPAYFLIIPYYRLMHSYGLMDSLWAVIAADVTFAVPYALLILQWYGPCSPIELDEAAQVEGATPIQVTCAFICR